jgi:hypothetical protein
MNVYQVQAGLAPVFSTMKKAIDHCEQRIVDTEYGVVVHVSAGKLHTVVFYNTTGGTSFDHELVIKGFVVK